MRFRNKVLVFITIKLYNMLRLNSIITALFSTAFSLNFERNDKSYNKYLPTRKTILSETSFIKVIFITVMRLS